MTIHLTYSDPAAQPAISLMRRAFPAYGGRTYKVRIAEGPISVRSYWDGGSRDYYAFVRLDGSAVTPSVPAQSAYDRPIAGADAVTLPDGVACVEHTIFCGKDMGLTLILAPSNAPALLPPRASTDDDITRLLLCTKRLKNTYGGETELRFKAAARAWQMTREAWDAARARAIEAGLLTKAGAITPEGRNAVASHPDRYRSL